VKILLAKLNHLGDTLLLTPTIRFLKEQFPEAEIDALVRSGCEDMLRGNPDLKNILTIARPEKQQRKLSSSLQEFKRNAGKLLFRGYDYAFDLSNSDRAKLWILLAGARVRGINDGYHSIGWKRRLFNRISYFEWGLEHQVLRDFRTVTDVLGIEAKPGPLRFFPQATRAELLTQLPQLSAPKTYVVIHPASRWAFKQWLPEHWASVADHIQQHHGLSVVFSCGPAERETALVAEIQKAARDKHLSTEGKLSLHQLGLLTREARLFIGVDTVAMHLAAAVQTPVAALFGPSSEWSWHPWAVPYELALGPCACKQTRKFICDKSQPYPCMQAITVPDVMQAIAKLLQKTSLETDHH